MSDAPSGSLLRAARTFRVAVAEAYAIYNAEELADPQQPYCLYDVLSESGTDFTIEFSFFAEKGDVAGFTMYVSLPVRPPQPMDLAELSRAVLSTPWPLAPHGIDAQLWLSLLDAEPQEQSHDYELVFFGEYAGGATPMNIKQAMEDVDQTLKAVSDFMAPPPVATGGGTSNVLSLRARAGSGTKRKRR